MKKTLLAMTAITMTLVGCAPKKTAETPKSLVLYSMTTIFVIDYNEEGIKPEFTQVVR